MCSLSFTDMGECIICEVTNKDDPDLVFVYCSVHQERVCGNCIPCCINCGEYIPPCVDIDDHCPDCWLEQIHIKGAMGSSMK